MTELPLQPWFVPQPKGENGGVDFLGLREANLQLMSHFLPGINNVTRHVRPYAVMSWLVWAFLQRAAERGDTTVSPEDFRRVRERVEVLFGWSHKLNQAGTGLVGNNQVCPGSDKDTDIELTFEAWKRNVSWFDPVFYGPSVRDESGLGFLCRHGETKMLADTEAGGELARALDAQMGLTPTQRDFLLSPAELPGSADLAKQLYSAWQWDDPSPQESEVFRQAFYLPDSIPAEADILGKGTTRTTRARRSAAVELIQETLRHAIEPVPLEGIRRGMACWKLPCSPTKLTNPREVERAQALWQVLQVRQAQRLAFECLFGWVEQRVLNREAVDSDQLAAALREGLDEGENEVWQARQLAALTAQKAAPGCWEVAGLNGLPEDDLFEHMVALERAARQQPDALPPRALRVLMLATVATEQLADNADALPYLNVGGTARVSLRHWARQVRAREHVPLQQFLTYLVERFLLSQHFGVALLRTAVQKPRLRLSLEDGGLTSLLQGKQRPWTPLITADRLVTGLSLMADCGLIACQSPGSSPTYVAAC